MDLDLYRGLVHVSLLLTLPLAASLKHLAATHKEVTAGSNSSCRIMASRRRRKLVKEKRDRGMDGWTEVWVMTETERHSRSIINLTNICCHKGKKAQRGSFRDKKQWLGKYWGDFSQFNPFRAEGVPGDFHQQKNEEIRLSQPAPFATKPPQTRLLRENGHPVKSEKQLRLKTSRQDHILQKRCNGKLLIILTRATWGVREEEEDGRGLPRFYLHAKKHTLPPRYQAAICRVLWVFLHHNGPQYPAWYPQLSP